MSAKKKYETSNKVTRASKLKTPSGEQMEVVTQSKK